MKKLLTFICVFSLILSISGCNSSTNSSNNVPTEGKYPTKWNDEEFYKTEADIDADVEKLKGMIDEFKKYEGKLDTVDGLLGFILIDGNPDYCVIYDRLKSYANFGMSVFPLEQKYRYCAEKFNEVNNQIKEARSYVDEEMASIPFEKRIQLFSDEKLIDYAQYYTRYLYEDLSFASQEMIDLYKNATLSQGRVRGLFDSFSNFEIPEVTYKLKNGNTVYISNRNARSIFTNDDYSFEDKKAMNDLWWFNASQYKNTLTSLLEMDMLEQYSNAKVNGFNSTKDQALATLGFEEDIIQKIIDYGHNSSDKLKDFYKLLADNNGKYYYFSSYNVLSPYSTDYINYDDGVDMVIDALSIMGDEYTSVLKEEFNSGHIDVYPSNNKQPGAFETGNYAGLLPFIMFNYNGTLTDVSTLSHETGHACYDILCNRNQSLYNWGAATFTHEVASLTNEMIFYNYMIDNAKTDEEKMFHLQKMLAMWSLNLYDSCYWQEFEQYCHELVESGQSFDCESLADKWIELGKEYYGEDFEQGEYGRYRWLTLSNLHNNYYEYSYATALCYATVLSEQLRNNEPGVKEKYIKFLKTGASTPSIEALKIAGIDIYDENVYNKAFSYFEDSVDLFRQLAKK